MTPTPTLTPSNTPTPTLVHYFLNTSTPRTLVPRTDLTSTGAPPTEGPRPTGTSIPPTQRPRLTSTSIQATNPPQQPTNRPRRATKTAKPPKPTKTPRRYVPVGDCMYPDSCYDFVPDYALRHREMSILELIKNET
jgi:hypothetical protein